MTRVWMSLALVALVVAGACGGGGGGDDEGDGLDGRYTYTGSINQVANPRFQVRWTQGDVQDGVAAFSGTFSIGGLINAIDVAWLFDVDELGNLGLRDPNNPADPPEALGWVRQDRAVAACMGDGGGPALHVFLKLAGEGLDEGVFVGDYHRITFGGTDDSYGSVLYTETADGQGTTVRDFGIGNFNGNANQLCVGGQDSYAIQPDGSMTLDVFSETYRGQVTPDGALAVLGGSSRPGSTPQLVLLLKAATAATNATFSGTYCTVCYSYDHIQMIFRGGVGTITSNGAGDTVARIRNNDGSGLAAPQTSSTDYTVAADGRLDLGVDPQSGDGFLRGAISADGAYAILWGGSQDGSSPQIYFLFREPAAAVVPGPI